MTGVSPRAIRLVTVAIVVVGSTSVQAQMESPSERRQDTETPRTTSGSTTLTVRGPTDTEILQPDRGVLNPSVQQAQPLPLEEPIDPNTYICGRGDTFEFNFWGQQNFRLRVTVDTEGRTFISKVGYVTVAGRTLAQARSIITREVHRFYPGLNFDLSLTTPRSFLVHVVGYVAHPGIYSATPVERLSSVLASAGGATGSRRRVEIRHRDGKTDVGDLVEYELSGDKALDPFVMDGDVIRVPFAELTTTISGAVKRPGRYELIKTKDISELIHIAGGLLPTTTYSLPIQLIQRDAAEHSEVVPLRFSATDRTAFATALHDGDEVHVPSVAELQRTVLLIGPVAGASAGDEATMLRRLPFHQGATVRTLIEAAGPIGASADLKNAYIRRQSGSVIPVDLEALLVRRDFAADRNVAIGDTIVVPQKRTAIAVEGAVLKPGVYPYSPKFRAEQYVETAGGPSKNAQSWSNFHVITSDGHSRPVTRNAVLQPGDTIAVPERAFSRSEIVSLVLGGAGLLLSTVTLVYLIHP